jgi:hypothetical protein
LRANNRDFLACRYAPIGNWVGPAAHDMAKIPRSQALLRRNIPSGLDRPLRNIVSLSRMNQPLCVAKPLCDAKFDLRASLN